MTSEQMIRGARGVLVSFGVAGHPADIDIWITKKEGLRLVKGYGLPANDANHPIGSVGQHSPGAVAVINFHT